MLCIRLEEVGHRLRSNSSIVITFVPNFECDFKVCSGKSHLSLHTVLTAPFHIDRAAMKQVCRDFQPFEYPSKRTQVSLLRGAEFSGEATLGLGWRGDEFCLGPQEGGLQCMASLWGCCLPQKLRIHEHAMPPHPVVPVGSLSSSRQCATHTRFSSVAGCTVVVGKWQVITPQVEKHS